jgi:hypothetical protein
MKQAGYAKYLPLLEKKQSNKGE